MSLKIKKQLYHKILKVQRITCAECKQPLELSDSDIDKLILNSSHIKNAIGGSVSITTECRKCNTMNHVGLQTKPKTPNVYLLMKEALRDPTLVSIEVKSTHMLSSDPMLLKDPKNLSLEQLNRSLQFHSSKRSSYGTEFFVRTQKELVRRQTLKTEQPTSKPQSPTSFFSRLKRGFKSG